MSQRSSTIVKVDSDGFGHYLSHLASGVFRKTRQIGAEDGWLGGGNSNIFYFHPYLGKIPILTNIFQMGWNHQPGWYFAMNNWEKDGHDFYFLNDEQMNN